LDDRRIGRAIYGLIGQHTLSATPVKHSFFFSKSGGIGSS
jgi:hypothetical protein